MESILKHQPIIDVIFKHLPVISMMSLKRAYPSCQNKFPNIYKIFEKRFNKLLRRYYNIEDGIKSFIEEPFLIPGDAISTTLFENGDPFVGCVYVVLNSSYNLHKYANFLILKCGGYENYSKFADKTIMKEFRTTDEWRLCYFSTQKYAMALLQSSTMIPKTKWRYIFSSSQLCVFNPYKTFHIKEEILPDLYPPPPPVPSRIDFCLYIVALLMFLLYVYGIVHKKFM